MEDKQTTVSIPAVARKGHADTKSWVVSIADDRVLAVAKSLADARRGATMRVSELLAGTEVDPAFARDDDGSLIVVIPYGASTRTYRITEDGWAMTTVGGPDTPAQRVANVWHWTPIPPR